MDRKNRRSRSKKHRHDRSYTLMLVAGDSGGRSHTLHLSFILAQILAFVAFAAVVAVICYIIYTSMTISSMRDVIERQSAQIAEGRQAADDAAIENERLKAQLDQLSLTLSQKLMEEEARTAAEDEEKLPVGVPVTGTATIINTYDDPDSTVVPGKAQEGEEATQGDHIVVFKPETGSIITASGAGVVESVAADAKYGGRISIDHGNGYVSIYRNSGTPLVREGEEVHRGDVLYTVGEDDQLLGYQIKQDGEFIDAETMLEING